MRHILEVHSTSRGLVDSEAYQSTNAMLHLTGCSTLPDTRAACEKMVEAWLLGVP